MLTPVADQRAICATMNVSSNAIVRLLKNNKRIGWLDTWEAFEQMVTVDHIAQFMLTVDEH